MVSKYLPKDFEKKWTEVWEKEKTYKTPLKIENCKLKIYALSMFPYPSGAGLHVGHVRIYTGTDVMARFFRMSGHEVMHPMGWDAFGLPAENAAIKAKKNPMDMVPKNIAIFKKQMEMLGFSYDWDKEFSTTDPEYYKWTQWLFIQFFKMGLLYKKNTPINFCPSCKTGLAEEEVLSDGTHERCGNKIEKKDLPQWIFKITAYADRLLKDLEGLDWPEGILEMQKNWIGKSEGVEIEFRVQNSELRIKVFTTAIDTIFGTTFMVLSPEHPLVEKLIKPQYKKEVEEYINKTKRKSDLQRISLDKTKTGIFTGSYCVNPFNGKNIPIWVADYVLMSYGKGAVMGVPGHDGRDHEFAKNYKLEIIPVIKPVDKVKVGQDGFWNYEEIKTKFAEKSVLFNSKNYDGLSSIQAKKQLENFIEKNKLGKRIVSYHLHDWIFSRQRYWGEPIPMVNCEKCGWQPIEEKDLPVELPYLKSYEPTETGESPLSKVTDWVKTECPRCGGDAQRETDTMPNWAGSCWYFLFFARQKKEFQISNFKFQIDWNWLPVDWYLGGAEHAVLHLLYSRFWVKALQDLGLLNFNEPFLRLRNVGMVLAEDHRKMSKSFGNIINPDGVVGEFGADSLRLYEMFMAPFNAEISWSTKALQGGYRFLKRIWETYQQYNNVTMKQSNNENDQLVSKLNKTIIKVTQDIQETKFNTAIAAMMEFLNEWEKQSQNSKPKTQNHNLNLKSNNNATMKQCNNETMVLSTENAKKFLQILAPFAPFITEEIWRNVFGEKTSIHLSNWPKAEKVTDEEIIIPVQVNGKLRSTLRVSSHKTSKDMVVNKVLEDEKIKKYLEGREYKVIYVEGKILNFVFE